MKLLLIFLLGIVVMGLFTDRLNRQVYALIVGGSIMVTGLFFTFDRFWL